MPPTLDRVTVIDADTYFTEPHELWTKRAPARLKDTMPHVVNVDGKPNWVINDTVLGPAGGGGVIDRDGVKGRAFEALNDWEIDRVHRGAYDPAARLEVMDESGISAQIIFPNVVGSPKRSVTRHTANCAPRCTTTRARRCKPSPTTGCSPWRSSPRGTSTRGSAKRTARRVWGCAAPT